MTSQPSLYDSPAAKLALHLLEYIESRMMEEITACERISDKQSYYGQRQVNIAGFCVQFLDDITKEKENYEQLQIQKGIR